MTYAADVVVVVTLLVGMVLAVVASRSAPWGDRRLALQRTAVLFLAASWAAGVFAAVAGLL